jgi:hypothetical protein
MFYIHYTFIVQDNKIIEYGVNRPGEPPIHYGYHAFNGYKPKIHSEIDAYKKAKGLLVPNKWFEIVNIRLNKQGKIRMSKPCFCCENILRELGCKKFYFSHNTGFAVLV